ncbi:MAG: response regulator [Sphingobacteriaceae bacterium]|nr:response regulator [Sphingobacteriaceae bacterium]
MAQNLTLRFDQLTSENGLPQNTIHGIVKDKFGFMWFGTWAGLCRYDGYKFTTYRSDPHNLRSIVNNRIHSLFKDSNQDIWIQTFDTLTMCKYNYETDDFIRIPQNKVPVIIKESNNRPRHYIRTYFIANQYKWSMDTWTKALVQTHIPSGKQHTYKANPSNKLALNDEFVADIYLDNHNILWVGTYSYGVNKANVNAKPFTIYHHDPDNKNSILDNNTRAILEDNAGNLWIGTRDKGITVINRKAGSFTHYTQSNGDNNTLINNQIRKIYQDQHGFIWIGTKKGLDRFDPKSKRFYHYGETLPSSAVYSIMEDSNKSLWVGTWRGLAKYDRKKDSFVNYDKSTPVQQRNIRVILEDRNKNLWVGSEGGGIIVFKRRAPGRENESLIPYLTYTVNGQTANGLSDNRIYSLYEDKQGLIWIGTGNGLNCYSTKTKKFRQFSVEHGLADAMIAGVLEDDNNCLWISHKRGLSKLNKRTFKVQNYTLKDGLQSNEFSEDTFHKSKLSKEMFFGGNNGFNTFYADSIKEEKFYPQIAFTDLQVLNKPVKINQKVNGNVILPKSLNLMKEITLSPEDKSIAIEFAALHFSNPAGNKYAYMLEGFDKDWIYTDASVRVASYSNLASGKYTFKVRASNSDGIWNPIPLTLGIIVIPPFWRTNWAYLFYLLIIAVFLYIVYVYSSKIASLKSKLIYESLIREKEYELHQSKLQFFTQISHEIKTPLTLILSPIERLIQMDEGNNRVYNQLTIMKRNGDRLLKLLNQLLDFRKFETGNIQLNGVERDIVSFIKEICISFEQLAAQRDISYNFIASPDVVILWFDEDKIEKIIFNLLSNAFKFVPDNGEITLSIQTYKYGISTQKLFIKVIDNGPGIPKNRIRTIFQPFQQYGTEGTGLGLSYSKGLAELHGGTITAESRLPDLNGESYTCFTVSLPITYKFLKNTDTQSAPAPSAAEVYPQQRSYLIEDGIDEVREVEDGSKTPIVIDGRKPVLAIIEDNEDMRNYLSSYFNDKYTVHSAEDGKKGIELVEKVLPDLVISDVMMPEMTGTEVCRRLKTDMRTSHIPIILLTARSPLCFKIEGLETGADDYITKPFSLKLLSVRVRNLLLSRISMRERFKTEFSLQPSNVAITSPDEKFLSNVLEYIESRISDHTLSVEDICREIGLSRTHLYRKTKALTGLSMADVIRNIRLKRAVQLLEQEKLNINEVAYMVGFLDVDYFRKCFKTEYGFTPSEFQKSSLKGRNQIN